MLIHLIWKWLKISSVDGGEISTEMRLQAVYWEKSGFKIFRMLVNDVKCFIELQTENPRHMSLLECVFMARF